MKPLISVIIGTYNHLSYLQLCLLSLERQTFRDFEVIVADDGSGREIKEWLKSYNTSFPVTHLWQEDKGFRKCKILNKAVKQSNSNYIVFIDADCILSKDFLFEHWHCHEKGSFLGGRRVLIAKKFAKRITAEMLRKGNFDGINLWGINCVLSGCFKYYEEALRPLYYIRKNNFFNLMGCNFSIHKSDLLLVGGFDEEYESRGGGEDTDVSLRLKVAGCRMKSVRYRAIQFHLGHDILVDKSKSQKLFSEKRDKIKTSDDAKKIKSSL
tara:strand:- start:8685 stop:9488 length:804 start_codon:yes stop_codon:yes gene_type:complete